MKKLALMAVAALAVAVPAAQAHKPADPGAAGKERAATKKAASKKCAPRSVGYVARGLYVSGALTQTKGADTAADTSDDRFSGTVVVDVKRTNKHARADKGETKTYTLTDAKVVQADRDGNGTKDAPVAGDRVKAKGKITRLNKKCDSTSFTPTLTIKRVQFLAPPTP